jgi:hypothetical protein
MKFAGIILLAALVSGCCTTKTQLVPQAYMPVPPAILMQSPQDLNTIKNNTTVTKEKAPKND